MENSEFMKKLAVNSKPIIALVFLVIVLFLGNLVLSRRILNSSIELISVESQALEIANETNELKVQIAIVTSSERILAEARGLGLIPTQEVLYLESYKTLAKND